MYYVPLYTFHVFTLSYDSCQRVIACETSTNPQSLLYTQPLPGGLVIAR